MSTNYDELLHVDYSTVQAVVDQVMSVDGSPIMHGQVRKTLRALIALGWNGWPE